jgi:hypothetical protein
MYGLVWSGLEGDIFKRVRSHLVLSTWEMGDMLHYFLLLFAVRVLISEGLFVIPSGQPKKK